ncbi:hypothetical protein O7626_23710 [Micromonospora sp. WMMD1102]|uniref:hypothetical protein n=1 Tax=Micromonospora sp. WMMD1102 TaxID=3016105 RepID=UPI0024153925|nr:hypothetical protein [Micromonospora sp. WMMD1102]MDG4788896.1 hypothetical protein [Micromonospora sp. WMMD1102]
MESPESAWRVFWSFLAVEIDGLESAPGGNADGFAVSWGRYSWSDELPTLSFNRHLMVNGAGPDWYQPERWRLSLDMVFPDLPAFADVGELNTQSSGIYCERPDSAVDDVVREVLWEIEQYPALQALWTSTPLRSVIGFGPRHPRVGNVEAFDAQQQAAYLEWRARYG